MTMEISVRDDTTGALKVYDLDYFLDKTHFIQTYGRDMYDRVIYLYPRERISFRCESRVDEV